MSRIRNREALIGVDDDLPNATLFHIQSIPPWSRRIAEFLSTAQLEISLNILPLQAKFLEDCSHFHLVSGRLYHLGDEGVLRLVPNPEIYMHIVMEAHVGSVGQHLSKQGTIS